MRIQAGFAIPLILLLALGTVINATSLGALHALLWKPLPYAQPERLVELRFDLQDAGMQVPLSHALYELLRADTSRYAGAVGAIAARPQVDASGHVWQVQRVTADFAEVLGVVPQHGRSLQGVDAAEHPLVLSAATAQARFGSAESALGQTLRLKQIDHHVVGVMPAGFSFPDAGVDAWIPYRPSASETAQDAMGGFGLFTVAMRLAEGANLDQARAGLAAVLAQSELLSSLRGSGLVVRADARPWMDRYRADAARDLSLLQAGALLLQAVVATNLAQLLLMRALARRRELEVRSALGASSFGLLCALLAELWLPALFALALGTALAPTGLGQLQHMGLLPPTLPDANGALWVGPIAALILNAISLLLALLPLLSTLRAPGQSELRARASSNRQGRIRRALLIAQVALTTILMGAAGLLVRSALELEREDRGFDAERVLMSTIDLQDVSASALARGDAPGLAVSRAAERIGERVTATAGVEATAFADSMPFGSSHFVVNVQPSSDIDPTMVRSQSVSHEFFEVMGMPLLRGRGFEQGAPAGSEVVIDTRLVTQLYGDADPIGARLRLLEGESATEARVVGVVAPVKFRSLAEQSGDGVVYAPITRAGEIHFRVSRTRGDPAALQDQVRAAMLAAEPDLVLPLHRPLAESMAESIATWRALLCLILALAVAVLLLSALGLYAVISLGVMERRSEFGIRLALGSRPLQVLALVMRQGLRWLALGLTLGLPAGILIAGQMREHLFGVEQTDALAWLFAAALLALTALIACALPALRAARLEPRAVLET
jgi:putative ABC transport system permease protein